jgi:hypothetical protein
MTGCLPRFGHGIFELERRDVHLGCVQGGRQVRILGSAAQSHGSEIVWTQAAL